MITFWGFLLGLPILAFGGAMIVSPSKSSVLISRFETSRLAALVLTTVAWIWTTYEILNFGANIFAEFANGSGFPPIRWILSALAFAFDHFWALTPVLIYLTYIWMPKNLSVRALTGILMLFPAALFRTTRHHLPTPGFSTIPVFVVTAYLAAIIGMYGMFYPWRLETALGYILRKDWSARLCGAILALDGLALMMIGCCT